MLLFSLVVGLALLHHIKNKHPAAMSEDGKQPKITSLHSGESIDT